MIVSKRFHRLSREGTWVVSGQLGAILGALVGVRILTELLTPSQYGELALGLTVSILFNQVIFGPLSQGAARFYAPALERDELGSYISVVRQLLLKATMLAVVLVLVTVGVLFAASASRWLPVTMAAFLFAILSGYNALLISIQNAARQRSVVAIHQGLGAWLRFLLAAAFIIFLGASSTSALYGYALATVLVLCSQLYFARRVFPVLSDAAGGEAKWQGQIRSYSWPFAVWGVFCWAQSASDRWALGLFETEVEVGLYATLFQIGYQPIALATGLAVQFIAPILFQRSGDATDAKRNAGVSHLTWQLTWLALGLTTISTVMAFLFHEAIFKVLVAPAYRSVSGLLPWMLLAGGLFAAAQVMSLKLMSMMKTTALMPVKVVTAMVGLLLNFVGAYWFGIAGIVAAMILFSLGYACWSALLFMREQALERSMLSDAVGKTT